MIEKRTWDEPEAKQFAEQIIEAVRDLFVHVGAKSTAQMQSLFSTSVLSRLLESTRQSIWYMDFLSDFHLTAVDAPGFTKARQEAYLFTPLLLQEFEGTIKKALQLVGFLVACDQGYEKNYEKFRRAHRYLPETIEHLKKALPQGDPIRIMADGLEPDDHPVRASVLRNASAHNDFLVVEEPGGTARIDFYNGEKLELSLPLDELLSLFMLTKNLASTLNIALHFGLRKVTGLPR